MIFTKRKEKGTCNTEPSRFWEKQNLPHSPQHHQTTKNRKERIQVEILKLLMQKAGVVKRTQFCTSHLCLKLINEKANPFSASLRPLRDTAGQLGITQGTNHASLASKRGAGLNRNNLYSLHPPFHVLSCNKVVNKHCLC